jgi:hypothetical protein
MAKGKKLRHSASVVRANNLWLSSIRLWQAFVGVALLFANWHLICGGNKQVGLFRQLEQPIAGGNLPRLQEVK